MVKEYVLRKEEGLCFRLYCTPFVGIVTYFLITILPLIGSLFSRYIHRKE